MALLTREFIDMKLAGQEDAWDRGFVHHSDGSFEPLQDYYNSLEDFEMENVRQDNYR